MTDCSVSHCRYPKSFINVNVVKKHIYLVEIHVAKITKQTFFCLTFCLKKFFKN